MENLLRKYMEERFTDQNQLKSPGRLPFITISREFGCPSKLIAKLLADALNDHSSLKKQEPLWRYINKEVVIESAHELDISPEKLQYIFNAEKKGALDDVFASFSDQYKSDRKIKKTLQDVIKTFVQKGNVILVGRGGVAITQNYTNALHIRLQAPLDWRIQGLCYRRGIAEDEAFRLTQETDRKRISLLEIFLGRQFELSLFDLVFNCQTFEPDDIVAGIIRMMEVRNMI
jgi:cytidylate kinase